MNGGQDMGGMMGFGPVLAEKDEPVFHAPWERRAFALTLAMSTPGGWNIDQSRAARESLKPAEYLAKSYYEIWIAGLEKLMADGGQVGPDEIDAGKSLHPPKAVPRILNAERVPAGLTSGGPTERIAAAPQRFHIGQHVRAHNTDPTGHTRIAYEASGGGHRRPTGRRNNVQCIDNIYHF